MMETRSSPALAAAEADDSLIPALTILLHPDFDRVGQVAHLEPLTAGMPVSLSRAEPLFSPPNGGEPWALADPFLSRRPAKLERHPAGFAISRTEDSVRLACDGSPLVGERLITRGQLERGVLLELGGRVVLLFHLAKRGAHRASDDLGLIGESHRLDEVRKSILAIRDRDVPVLLRGETGTGKELVALAIHRSSSRNGNELVSVNIAALSPSVAISELFGHVKGAFTGATDHHSGMFARAHRGTLFLDEIGEAPIEVQVMLLRALETGKIQRIGAKAEEPADVRLIAATDANLEAAVDQGKFRLALFHRLSAFTIQIPPLRARVEDLGRLFFHFLRQELRASGEEHRLRPAEGDAQPYVSSAVLARLARHDWPGNVRELRNIVRQLVISSSGAPVLKIGHSVERLLDRASAEASAGEAPRAHRVEMEGASSEEPAPRIKPSEITEERLIEALRAHRWSIEPTARSLGISRPTLYALIDNCKSIRKAKDVPEEEIARLEKELGGDVDAMAEALQVSGRGLKRRLKALRSPGEET